MALAKTLPILLLFLIGVAFKKAGILKKADGRMISGLILTIVFLPAAVLSSMDLSPGLLQLPLAGLVVVTMLLVIGFALVPLLGLQHTTRGAFLIAFPTLELGSIGDAFLFAAYRTEGLAAIIFMDLGSGFFSFTVVAFLLHFMGMTKSAVVLAASLPACLMTIVLSRENHLDTQFLASMLSVAFPLLMAFFHG